MELDSHKLLVGAGVAADSTNFTEYIQKNLKLYELNNDLKLGTKATANYIRGEVRAVNFYFLMMKYIQYLSCINGFAACDGFT